MVGGHEEKERKSQRKGKSKAKLQDANIEDLPKLEDIKKQADSTARGGTPSQVDAAQPEEKQEEDKVYDRFWHTVDLADPEAPSLMAPLTAYLDSPDEELPDFGDDSEDGA